MTFSSLVFLTITGSMIVFKLAVMVFAVILLSRLVFRTGRSFTYDRILPLFNLRKQLHS